MTAENIIKVTDFQRDVLGRSMEVPVVVDFWAEWCGPCRVLGPVLERLAGEADGRWILAPVNTEEFGDVAMTYGVQSIPCVKLFVEGNVADEFVGALPEYAVRQWLEKAVPGPSARLLAEAGNYIREGNPAAAREALNNVLKSDPENAGARVLTARLSVMEDPALALRLIEGIEEPLFQDDVDFVKTVVRLHGLAENPGGLPPGPMRDTYLGAIRAFLAGDPDTALASFIAVIREDRYYDDDGSRKACIAVFRLLGEEHELSVKHRRDFGSALYI